MSCSTYNLNKTAPDAALGEEGQLERWLPLVRSRANAFRRKGVEDDDLIQEGLIGLLYAVRAYNCGSGASFETFAYTCITNRLRSAVAKMGRQSSEVSLDDESGAGALNQAADSGEDPQEIFISSEQAAQWLCRVEKALSPLESRAMRLYLGGYSYQEMASILKTSPKSVDNALCRAKAKLRSV